MFGVTFHFCCTPVRVLTDQAKINHFLDLECQIAVEAVSGDCGIDFRSKLGQLISGPFVGRHHSKEHKNRNAGKNEGQHLKSGNFRESRHNFTIPGKRLSVGSLGNYPRIVLCLHKNI